MTVCLVTWGLSMAVIYGLAPHMPGTPDTIPSDLAGEFTRPVQDGVPRLAALSVCLFGIAWLFSSVTSSPALSMSAGILAPALIRFLDDT